MNLHARCCNPPHVFVPGTLYLCSMDWRTTTCDSPVKSTTALYTHVLLVGCCPYELLRAPHYCTYCVHWSSWWTSSTRSPAPWLYTYSCIPWSCTSKAVQRVAPSDEHVHGHVKQVATAGRRAEHHVFALPLAGGGNGKKEARARIVGRRDIRRPWQLAGSEALQ